MRKSKIAFSAMIMMLIVGMCSAVFATNPNGHSAAPAAPTTAPDQIKDYMVKWGDGEEASIYFYMNKDSSTSAKKLRVATNAAKVVEPALPTYVTAAADNGKVRYEADIIVDGGAPQHVVSTKEYYTGYNTSFAGYLQNSFDIALSTDVAHTITIKNAIGYNEIGASTPSVDATITTKAITEGTEIPNANLTGLGNKNKAWTGQTVHGNYQNNTNSCASCHKTHTGQDGNFLFKNGTVATCDACHDGSVIGAGALTTGTVNAGNFHKTAMTGASDHNVFTAAEEIGSAPGGNEGGSGAWSSELTCASCHNPHGSASAFLLNGNIMGDGNKRIIGSTVVDGGALATVSLPAVKTTDYILVKTTVDVTKSPFNKGYYNETYKNFDGKPALLTAWWNAATGSYQLDYPLWNFTYGATNTGAVYAQAFRDALAGLTLDYKHGLAVDTTSSGKIATLATTFDIVVGVSVQPHKNAAGAVENRSYTDSAFVDYNAGSGRQMSVFCTQCHADYMSATHNLASGTYTQAFRHSTYSDRLSCTQCHFAHGTDNTIMRDAAGKNITDLTAVGGKFAGDTTSATAYLTDTNNSSALKRYVGMSVCFSCHGKEIDGDNLETRDSVAAQNGFGGNQGATANPGDTKPF